jgi:hypothetical protein
VKRWGWVAKSKLRILPHAHPLEKSAPGFEDTSIYRLSRQQIEKSRFIADSSPSAVMWHYRHVRNFQRDFRRAKQVMVSPRGNRLSAEGKQQHGS